MLFHVKTENRYHGKDKLHDQQEIEFLAAISSISLAFLLNFDIFDDLIIMTSLFFSG